MVDPILISIPARALCRKYLRAKENAAESHQAFEDLSEMVRPQDIALWSAAESDAVQRRDKDPAAMDVYDVKADRGKLILFFTAEEQNLHMAGQQPQAERLLNFSSGRRNGPAPGREGQYLGSHWG